MAKRKATHSHHRRKSVGATTHRRRTHRRKGGMMGALPANIGEKVIGITLGSAGISMLEGVILKKKPTLNPMIIGGGELIIGALLSGNAGMEGYIGDGMIAAGAINLARMIKAKAGGGMQGPEYVIQGTNYITGQNDMYITEDGYVVNGAGEYITDNAGNYITGADLEFMGDVNQGGLGDVNQGGLG